MRNSKNEDGIAVVVVVAIMVALVMVTTALLGVVTRTSGTSKIYFERDLARIAALSGKAYALNFLNGTLSNTATASTLNPSTIMTSGDHPLTVTNSAYVSAYGLAPYAKVGVEGRAYGLQCPVLKPMEWAVADNDAALMFTDQGAAITKLSKSTSFDKSITDLSGYWQMPSNNYYKYINIGLFNKDFAGTPPAAVTNSFYATYYAVCIQDLGGCLNVHRVAGRNEYDTAQLNNIYKGMGGANITAASLTSLSSTTNYPRSFSDIAKTIGVTNDAYLVQRSQLTPWGKEDTSGVPLCVNVYTASEGLITGMLINIAKEVDTAQFKIHRDDDASTADDEGLDISVSTVLGSDANRETIAKKIAAKIVNNRDGVTISSIVKAAVDIDDGSWTPAQKTQFRAAANILVFALTGQIISFDDIDTSPPTIAGSDSDRAMVTKISDSTSVPISWYTGKKFGRLVGDGSTGGLFSVHTDTIGPGPYFRVTVRGVLMNLAKSEIVTQANLEFVYDKSANEIVFQKWFENE